MVGDIEQTGYEILGHHRSEIGTPSKIIIRTPIPPFPRPFRLVLKHEIE